MRKHLEPSESRAGVVTSPRVSGGRESFPHLSVVCLLLSPPQTGKDSDGTVSLERNSGARGLLVPILALQTQEADWLCLRKGGTLPQTPFPATALLAGKQKGAAGTGDPHYSRGHVGGSQRSSLRGPRI